MNIIKVESEKILKVWLGEEVEGYEKVDENIEWTDEGDYMHAGFRVKHNGKFYEFGVARYLDGDTDIDGEGVEVVLRETWQKVWIPVQEHD